MEPKWSRQFVEEHLMPPSPALQALAVQQYESVLQKWLRHDAHGTADYDAQRFSTLLDVVEDEIAQLLAPYSRRLLFNTFLAVRPGEWLDVMNISPGDPDFMSSVHITTSRAIMTHGQRKASQHWGTITTVAIPRKDWGQLERLPAVLTKLFALVTLKINAEIGYRLAGKGMHLLGVGKRFEWRWERDLALERAIREYDRRRRRSRGSVAGMLVPEKTEDESDWYWPNIAYSSTKLTIDYPELGLSHTSHARFLRPTNITERLTHLTAFPTEFKQAFGLDVRHFTTICQTLAQLIWHQTAQDRLDSTTANHDELHLTYQLSPKDDRSTSAPGYLRDIIEEGVLRAPWQRWHEMLVRRASALDRGIDDSVVDSFMKSFTLTPGKHGPKELAPILFLDVEENSLMLDLNCMTQFHELCFRAAVARHTGAIGHKRGTLFERQAREFIIRELSLSDNDIPVSPNHKTKRRGQIVDENDFCFVADSVLVVLDMKGWARSLEYHQGQYEPIRNRQTDLITKYIRKQLEPREHLLIEQIRSSGRHITGTLGMLCTADVEFLHPQFSELWYGRIPRVLTPVEIVRIVQNRSRWRDLKNFVANRCDD
ncbi:hypothetical protein ACRAKI_12570 [Saccharothrix isguenensis]